MEPGWEYDPPGLLVWKSRQLACSRCRASMQVFDSYQFLEYENRFSETVVLYSGIGYMAPANRELRRAVAISVGQPEYFRIEDNTLQFLLTEQILRSLMGKELKAALGIRIVYPQIDILYAGIYSGRELSEEILVLPDMSPMHGA